MDGMDMTVRVTASSNILYVVAGGEFTIDDARRVFVEVVDEVIANQSEKILFDGRSISGNPEIIERFFYGEFTAISVKRPLEEGAILTPPRFAYILLPPVLDLERLGETVAVNQGLHVKAFDNLTDGIDWLGLVPGDLEGLAAKGSEN